jgi:3-oxoacyl-[acyl-carrier protein] reductase
VRRALVTGGASPLGAAICRRLAADGVQVLVHAHAGLDRARAVADEVRQAGGAAEAVRFDVTDTAATAAAIEDLLAANGPIQILVHNAGIHDDVPMAGMAEGQWRSVIDVSLNGFYAVARPLLLPMMSTRWGRIVAISSLSAIMGNRGQVNYAAAKAGLIGAVKALSLECASRGITVNAVAPGIIESPAVAAVLTKERIAAVVPMKRAGKPEEVADLVAFLASDRAAYISGQTISINGGMA